MALLTAVLASDHRTAGWSACDIIAWARATLHLTDGEIGQAVGATVRTVQQWERGATAPFGRHREQLRALEDLRALLDAVFANRDAAMRWLTTALPSLGGITPRDHVSAGETTSVVGLLASVEAGQFTEADAAVTPAAIKSPCRHELSSSWT